MHAGGHEVVERLDHRVAALAVHLAHLLDLAEPVVLGEVRRDRHLRERRWAQRGRLLREHELLAHGVRRQRPARPACRGRTSWRTSPGRSRPRPRRRAGRASARRRSRAGRRGCPRARGRRPSRQMSSTSAAPADRQRHAGGVVEVRDRVEELDRAARPPGPRRWRRGAPPGPGRRRPSRRARRRHWKDLKTPSAPTYDGASQSTTSPGSQKIRVTRSTACWEPTVTTTSSGWASMPSRRMTSRDLLAQPRVALAGAVLQGHRPLGGDQVADGAADDVEGEPGDVGHPARQRDDLGPGRDREQGPDLRRGHAGGAGRVAVDVGVQPRARAGHRAGAAGRTRGLCSMTPSSMRDHDRQRSPCPRSWPFRSSHRSRRRRSARVARKIVRLTVDHLAALEAPTRDCLFWELDPVRRARVPAHERGRREGGLALRGAARVGLLRAGGAGRRACRSGTSSTCPPPCAPGAAAARPRRSRRTRC